MLWNPFTRYVATKLNQLTTYIPPSPRHTNENLRRILLIHAHPREDSFSSALAAAVVEGAREGGHEIRRRSLYTEGFNPALTSDERGVYFDTEKGELRLAPEVR
jgi:hypothetical protein